MRKVHCRVFLKRCNCAEREKPAQHREADKGICAKECAKKGTSEGTRFLFLFIEWKRKRRYKKKQLSIQKMCTHSSSHWRDAEGREGIRQ